jgi:Fe-S-cluster containining protein
MVKSNKFLKVCQKCKAACCRMGGPDFTEAEMKKVLKAGHKNYFFEVRDGIYELKSKKGRCRYLKKDNSCEIQNVKPRLCQSWPVFPRIKNNKRKYLIIDCPITALLSNEQIAKCKIGASRIPKELLDVALDNSTLSKSNAKLIKTRFDKFKKQELK